LEEDAKSDDATITFHVKHVLSRGNRQALGVFVTFNCAPIYTATPTAHHGSTADGLKEPDTSFPSSDIWFESGHRKVFRIGTAYSVYVEGYSTESWQIAPSPQDGLSQAGELGHSRAWDSGVAAGQAAVVLLLLTCLPSLVGGPHCLNGFQ